MTQIKKKLIASLIIIFLILPIVVFAVSYDTLVEKMMGRIITFVWQFFAGLSVIMFIYAGILFVTASGAPDKITKARMSFLWGAVGIVVAIVAYSMVFIIEKITFG